jgi:AhpD family alkylhydroperoxidase
VDKPYTHAADQVRADLKALREAAPDAMKAFGALALAATTTKALDTKTKELMAVAIGIAIRCQGCIATHMRSAVKAGATRQEAVETIALAVYMGGGPAVVYGGEALRAFDEYAAPPAQ